MFASFLVCVALSCFADTPEGVSSFSDGPLRIAGKQLLTSILKPETKTSSVPCWKCQAEGASTLRFGDIEATANGITVTQIDGNRYAFVLTGGAELRIRKLSATATKISWSMDDRPMVLAGDARLTIVIDGESTTVAADTITFDGKDNTVKLSDGTTRQLPSSKTLFMIK